MIEKFVRRTVPKENVIFLHLPKTAGSTINFILDRQYHPEIIHKIEGDTLASLKEFEQLSPQARQKIRVFKGHGEYGIHKFLFGESKYFTFLRDPIDRVISDYYFILRAPATPYHKFVTENKLSLKETVECQAPLVMMPNSQTILLAGLWRAGVKECTEETLHQAKENLRNHFVVGLTEAFDTSLYLLKSFFNWNTYIFYKKANVTRNRPARETVPPDALEAIMRTNHCDLALYEYGKALFAEQIQQMGPWFPQKVRSFQLANKLYGELLKSVDLWHKLKK